MLRHLLLRLDLRQRIPGLMLFVGVWSAVLAVSPLHLLLRVQLGGSPGWFPSLPWGGGGFDLNDLPDPQANTLEVQAARLQQEWTQDRSATNGYDQLIQRFPGRAWLLADRLKSTLTWLEDERVAGELENNNPRPNQPPPEDSGNNLGWKRKELQAALALAHRGQKLEPANGFFDWMLICLLLAGRRDADACVALHEASFKPPFDGHEYDSIAAAIAADGLIRPLMVEEKLVLVNEAFQQDIGLSVRMSHVANLLCWKARKLERAGRYAAAIRIRADLGRMGGRIKHGRHSVRASQIGEAMQYKAWHVIPDIRPPHAKRVPLLVRANEFAAYARSHGKGDLALEAMRLASDAPLLKHAVQLKAAPPNSLLPCIPLSLARRMESLWLLQLCSLLLIGVVTLPAVMLSLLLIKAETGRANPLDQAAGAAAGLAVAAAAAGIECRHHFGADLLLNIHPQMASLAPEAVYVFLPLPVAVFIMAITWRHVIQTRRLEPSLPSPLSTTAPHRYVSRFRVWALASLLALPVILLIAAAVAYLTKAVNWPFPLFPVPRDMWPDMYRPEVDLSLLAVPAALFAGLAWLLRWRFMLAAEGGALTRYGLRWCRDTMASLILVSSVCYLLFGLMSLQPRRVAEARFNELMQEGETQLLMQPAIPTVGWEAEPAP